MTSRSEDERALRDEQAQIYDSLYMAKGTAPFEVEDRMLIEALDLNSVGSLLDVGCGTGRLLAQIAARYPDLKIWGLDLSPKSLDIAKSRAFAANFCAFDITREEIQDATKARFDRVLSVQVLQHLYPSDHSSVLKKLVSSLNPGGKLVIQLYNHSGLNRKVEQGLNGRRGKEVSTDLFYEYRFSPVELNTMFSPYGQVQIYGCQVTPRRALNKIPCMRSLDIRISKSVLGRYLSYYFIVVLSI